MNQVFIYVIIKHLKTTLREEINLEWNMRPWQIQPLYTLQRCWSSPFWIPLRWVLHLLRRSTRSLELPMILPTKFQYSSPLNRLKCILFLKWSSRTKVSAVNYISKKICTIFKTIYIRIQIYQQLSKLNSLVNIQ